MTVLADFEVIVKGYVDIGDGGHEFSAAFDTSGVYTGKPAMISFMVSGLSAVALNDPEVLVNDQFIGRVSAYHWSDPKLEGEGAKHWHAQHLTFGGFLLKNGKNVFRVRSAKLENPKPGNEYDDFTIGHVVCHYHQEV
ncbi:hypothetical protein ACFYOT_17645 [Saccharothrix saharensis]|uniref:hypothetical protein n=1 Tax=Saccharothrix saharensis TaxID=571190 RepID=UPI0036BB9F90